MAFLSKYFQERAEKKRNKAALDAAHQGDFKTALEMIGQGVNVNLVGTLTGYSYEFSYKFATSFGLAAIHNANTKALEALFSRNLDVNQTVGEKPLLMYALEQKQERVAEMLLDRGARTDYVRQDLETPLSLAEQLGYAGVVSRIKNKPAAPAPEAETSGPLTTMKPLTLRPSHSAPT